LGAIVTVDLVLMKSRGRGLVINEGGHMVTVQWPDGYQRVVDKLFATIVFAPNAPRERRREDEHGHT
jgi:hypothetical protein